jgi:hypothetical protein
MNKMIIIIFFVFMSMPASAGSYSNWAIPTHVELVGGGVLIHGAFGDPNGCGKPNYIFVSGTDIRYDSVLSMSLSALMGKKEMRFYSSQCTSVGFHWTGNVINHNLNGQAVYVR